MFKQKREKLTATTTPEKPSSQIKGKLTEDKNLNYLLLQNQKKYAQTSPLFNWKGN